MTNSQTTAEVMQPIDRMMSNIHSPGCKPGRAPFAVPVQCKSKVESRGAYCAPYNAAIDAYRCSAQC